MPLDVWQAGPEVPEPDQSAVLGRFDDPLDLSSDYTAASPNDEWHLWTTSAGDKTEDKLGVTVRLYNRELTFDSTGTLVKVNSKNDTNAKEETRYLHPWQCYITKSVPDSCKVKINPVSTLMQTYNYRAHWAQATWKDAWAHANIDSFGDTFTLTEHSHCVWMEVIFGAGDITNVKICKGNPGEVSWYSDLRYVSSSNSVSDSSNFTWYQLLAYFKLSSSGDGGDEVDAVFDGLNYKLMCPTTTHLMQSYIHGTDSSHSYYEPAAHYAIVPWYGCVFPDS